MDTLISARQPDLVTKKWKKETLPDCRLRYPGRPQSENQRKWNDR